MMRFLFCLCFCVSLFGYSLEQRSLQIVGCCGSGTIYTSKCLQVGGLDVGHEYVASFGYVGWPFVAGFYDSGKNRIPGARFAKTFHQVRNPLKVISTCFKMNDMNRPEWRFIRSIIPEMKERDHPIVQCSKYWYYWNKKAEAMSEWTYQVEALNDVIEEFETRLGVTLDREAILAIPRNTHPWQGKSHLITWALLKDVLPEDLFQNIQEMAYRYGYSITDA